MTSDSVNLTSLSVEAEQRERDADLPALPPLPQSLLDTIGDYGMARTDECSDPARLHRWQLVIDGIKGYATEYARAALLAAPAPLQVQDSGHLTLAVPTKDLQTAAREALLTALYGAFAPRQARSRSMTTPKEQAPATVEGLMKLVKDVEDGVEYMTNGLCSPRFYEGKERRDKARAAIRAYATRLASPVPPTQAQEPVAWANPEYMACLVPDGDDNMPVMRKKTRRWYVPLYTSPAPVPQTNTDEADFSSAVPSGDLLAAMPDREQWAWVPMYPTGEMYEGFRSINCRNGDEPHNYEFTRFHGDFGNWAACYLRMIEAAPSAPRSADNASPSPNELPAAPLRASQVDAVDAKREKT